MPIHIQKTSTIDVTRRNNSLQTLYCKGDESTDGSIRFFIDDICQIQKRVSGSWNNTKLRTGGASLEIGYDLFIESAGGFIKIQNPSAFDGNQFSLVVDVPYDAGTGTLFPHFPIVDSVGILDIFTDAISEVSGTTIDQTFTVTNAQIVESFIYEVGTVGASSEVVQTLYLGTDNTGIVLEKQTIPASEFPADSTVTIALNSTIGLSASQSNLHLELVTDTAFTLKTDVSSNILLTLTTQLLEVRDILYDDLVYDASLNYILDSKLNPIYSQQFP